MTERKMQTGKKTWLHILLTFGILGLVFVGFAMPIHEQVTIACHVFMAVYVVLLTVYQIAFFAAKKYPDMGSNGVFLTKVIVAYVTGKHSSKLVDHFTYSTIVAALAGTGQFFYAIAWTWFWYEDFKHRDYAQHIMDSLDDVAYQKMIDDVNNLNKQKEERT